MIGKLSEKGLRPTFPPQFSHLNRVQETIFFKLVVVTKLYLSQTFASLVGSIITRHKNNGIHI